MFSRTKMYIFIPFAFHVFVILRFHYELADFILYCLSSFSRCVGNIILEEILKHDRLILLNYKPHILNDYVTFYCNIYGLLLDSQFSLMGRASIVFSFIYVFLIVFVLIYLSIKWARGHKGFVRGDGIRIFVYVTILHLITYIVLNIIFIFFPPTQMSHDFGIRFICLNSIISYTMFTVHLYIMLKIHKFPLKCPPIADSFVTFIYWHVINLALIFLFALTKFSVFFIPFFVIIWVFCPRVHTYLLRCAIEQRESDSYYFK